MRVLISGGGTGGHIYPALAVATRLRDTYNAEILYLGSDDGLETKLIPDAGLRLVTVKAGKLRRYISWHTLIGAARVPMGILQAVSIVRSFRPHVAFTSGGYVAVPAGLAARLNGVPLLMHQQDVPPNLSNRVIAPLATCISVTFADSQRYFPVQKTVQLGNPVRQELLAVQQSSPQHARLRLGLAPEVPLLLVTGGSQGARHLNRVVCHALPELLMHCQVLHISGATLFDETCMLSESTMAGLERERKQRYRLLPYLSEEMALALQAADLVICRAGAATLSELALLGKPAILVPLPPGFGSSPQEVNAAMFERHKAAKVIRNADLNPEELIKIVNHNISSCDILQVMSEAARSLAKPDATQEIVETIVKMAHGAVTKTAKREVLNT